MSNGSEVDVAFQTREIARLREKLLDLTRRNGLLNFSHSRNGAFVRVIDELPDQLFDVLRRDEMGFEPLPDPDTEPADERTEAFQNAMAIAQLTDEEYLRSTADLGEAEADTEKLAEADTALRHRVREKLGLPKLSGGKRLDIAALARANGFDPSFDLPRQTRAGDDFDALLPAHQDDKHIRILLTGSQAERRLRTIFDRNRTLENETGIHTLQIGFGFIEWRDPKQPKGGPFHAPLLTMPIRLRRKIVDGSYRFWASAPDAELTVNLALMELLKRDHGVALSALEDDDTPESYFSRIASHIDRAKYLSLRRFVTIAVFPFPRMGLWADLDPEIWPERSLVRHEGLARLLGGLATEGAAGAFGVDHPIEDKDWVGRVPPIVLPADVSQHSAILDAMEGKDLVVEGPPGTGKSQTIANLIAAATGAGKRILFLAEKRTALEAVAKRLRERGLAPTLLELHSEKTSKPEVMASLGESLAETVSPSQGLAALRGDQRRESDVLRTYLGALQDVPKESAGTVWSLIWRETALRHALKDRMADAIRSAHVGGAALTDEVRFRHAADTLAELAEVASQVSARLGGLRSSPWHQGSGLPVQPHAQEALIRALSGELGAGFDGLEAAFDEFGELAPDVEPWSLSESALDELCASIAQMVFPGSDHLTAAALDGRMDQTTQEQAVRLANYYDGRAQLVSTVDPADRSALSALEDTLVSEGISRASAETLRAKARGFEADAYVLRRIETRVSAYAELLGPEFSVSASTAKTLRRLDLIRRRYEDEAWDMQSHVSSKRRREHLDTLADRSKAVRDRLGRIASEVDMETASSLPNGELSSIADRVESAGFLSRVFSSEFKRAMARARSLAPRVEDRSRLASLLREAASIASEWEDIRGDADGRAAFGSNWRGPESSFATVDDASACLRDVNAFLVQIGGDQSLRAVLQLPAEQLARFTLTSEEADSLERINQSASLKTLATALQDRAAEIAGMADRAVRLGARPEAMIVDDGERLSDRLDAIDRGVDALKSTLTAEQLALTEAAAEDLDGAREALAFSMQPVIDAVFGKGATIGGDERLSRLRRLAEIAIVIRDRLDTLRSSSESQRHRLGDAFGPLDGQRSLEQRRNMLRSAIDDSEGLRLHANFERYLGQAEEAGVRTLFDVQAAADKPFDALPAILELLRCQQMLEPYFTGSGSPFGTMTTGRLNTALTRFKSMESQLYAEEATDILAKARANASKAPWGNDSGPIKSYTQGALIANEIPKQKRHIPIRQLIERAGEALQAMKPVLMMSPHALAQYAPPGTLEFDLVVIDEASQMKPEFAVGALARGAQYVVVGDQKQLPPTDFFSASQTDDEDDDGGAAELAESILDLASSRLPHKRRLRWHYRSQHPSLIAYSNREFYDRELVIFPAATNDETHGVRAIEVDGLYQSNVNPVEAEQVIEEARRLIYQAAEDATDLSLGIATMNLKQSDLINAEFERLAARDPVVRAYVERWEGTVEPVFVKNIENVQGDERDVIIISTLFGPAEPGARPRQNFGAINRAAGHRRLNVLFTRAKRAMIVVTSLKTGDIAPTSSSSRGVHVFKGFLDYARGGAVYDDAEGAEAESPFEEFVAAKLKEASFDVVHQIGVEGFRIDLAVCHPDDPSIFIAGIECDGAPFHQGLTVRDRDVIRQQVLEGLGWSIWRIWSTDWYNDPDGEAGKLVSFLERRKAVVAASRMDLEELIAADVAAEASGDLSVRTADEVSSPEEREPVDASSNDPSAATPLTPSNPVPEADADEPEEDASHAPSSGSAQTTPPRGRHIKRNHLDIYEVMPGLFEVRRDGIVLGEVERMSGVGVDRRLTAGTAPSLPRFKGMLEGREISFTTTDVYEAFDRLDRETQQ